MVKMLLAITIVLFAEGNGGSAFAYEKSLREAFCRDYSANKLRRIFTQNKYYEAQKAYNWCIRNAQTLIRDYEAKKEDERRQRLKRSLEYEKTIQKKRLEERKQDLEKQNRDRKFETLLENVGDLFR